MTVMSNVVDWADCRPSDHNRTTGKADLNLQQLALSGSGGRMMPFTDNEKRRWHEAKRKGERGPEPAYRSQPVAICLHCQNPLGINDGVITDEVALCDVCNGD